MKVSPPAFPTWIETESIAHGMTLRDYFAAAAFSSAYLYERNLFKNELTDEIGPTTISEMAYCMADAMMEERNK
jgi:hypothetical protein